MQTYTLVCLILAIALTQGLFFSSKPKCPIKQYKSSKYIVGDKLLVNEDFYDRVKALDDVAKDCKVHIYVKGSYYQLPNPSQQVLVSDADLVIGHGFQFEVRNENNALLCNKLCLSRTPTDIAEVRCLLQGVTNRGLTWSRYYPDVISDGTYASNTYGYQTLKTDIQTRCEKEKFKRQLLRALRQMYNEDGQDSDNQDDDDDSDDKKKK